jgi:hypothetical protein
MDGREPRTAASRPGPRTWNPSGLTYVKDSAIMTHMVKTQVYLREEELEALHRAAERAKRPVAALVREAIRRVWLRTDSPGPVALWDGVPGRTSAEHDAIYDEP